MPTYNKKTRTYSFKTPYTNPLVLFLVTLVIPVIYLYVRMFITTYQLTFRDYGIVMFGLALICGIKAFFGGPKFVFLTYDEVILWQDFMGFRKLRIPLFEIDHISVVGSSVRIETNKGENYEFAIEDPEILVNLVRGRLVDKKW